LTSSRNARVGEALLLLVIPAKAGLRRQDAGANIGEADDPKGEAPDAASNPPCFSANESRSKWTSACAGVTEILNLSDLP
jgi:hypothetical protein